MTCEEGKHEYDVQHEVQWEDRFGDHLEADEVRRRWPRRLCRKCGAMCYESYIHYLAGDW